ncbi:hypothetical protein [Streptomyces litchfieldiae]|uniref:Uncharacterized protein n=1 Tax=Streptomyces litchfieldiae TaxID=3075543 RepID=A0ABU2MPJ2_9ACTN|nr:hypothetical protein [Streptomyces sp. DSM 44938]MDT0342564.1 hypothetical protein [Streptomyces sp. DSM 44938]
MSVPGTIGRPAQHGPRRNSEMTFTTNELAAARRSSQEENRTRKLQLIPEALARSHMAERAREAESQRMAGQLAHARRLERKSQRLQRKAERASNRARRALAQAVMQ